MPCSLGIDDVCGGNTNKHWNYGCKMGFNPVLISDFSDIKSHFMAHIIDLLWLIQQGPISDNIHLCLGRLR